MSRARAITPVGILLVLLLGLALGALDVGRGVALVVLALIVVPVVIVVTRRRSGA